MLVTRLQKILGTEPNEKESEEEKVATFVETNARQEKSSKVLTCKPSHLRLTRIMFLFPLLKYEFITVFRPLHDYITRFLYSVINGRMLCSVMHETRGRKFDNFEDFEHYENEVNSRADRIESWFSSRLQTGGEHVQDKYSKVFYHVREIAREWKETQGKKWGFLSGGGPTASKIVQNKLTEDDPESISSHKISELDEYEEHEQQVDNICNSGTILLKYDEIEHLIFEALNNDCTPHLNRHREEYYCFCELFYASSKVEFNKKEFMMIQAPNIINAGLQRPKSLTIIKRINEIVYYFTSELAELDFSSVALNKRIEELKNKKITNMSKRPPGNPPPRGLTPAISNPVSDTSQNRILISSGGAKTMRSVSIYTILVSTKLVYYTLSKTIWKTETSRLTLIMDILATVGVSITFYEMGIISDEIVILSVLASLLNVLMILFLYEGERLDSWFSYAKLYLIILTSHIMVLTA